MLREEHLLGTIMKMKLGVVLKFKNALASKVGSCPVCLHCIQCHKSSDILNPNKANIDSDDRMTNNTSNNTSPQKHEENHCKSNELLSFHLDMISASSKLDALRNNVSKETTENNVEHVEKEHDGEK